jgi:hypothetical protein
MVCCRLLQAAKSGRVPRDLVKALKRRKMFARKGGRKGEGEAIAPHRHAAHLSTNANMHASICVCALATIPCCRQRA